MIKEKKLKLTFKQSAPILCPLCKHAIYPETLMQGGGRLVASDLSPNLRRNYIKSKKYGYVYPLLYSVTTCPKCLYSSLKNDFALRHKKEIEIALQEDLGKRKQIMQTSCSPVNWNEPPTLHSGFAAYLLALHAYSFLEKKYAPSLKKAICCIRLAWICEDLNNEEASAQYKYLAHVFYQKARCFYGEFLTNIQTGKELADENLFYGPDTDNNFGYQGSVYLHSYLYTLYPEDHLSEEEQMDQYKIIKSTISKIFGIGKSSKETPDDFLKFARKLYDRLDAIINKKGDAR